MEVEDMTEERIESLQIESDLNDVSRSLKNARSVIENIKRKRHVVEASMLEENTNLKAELEEERQLRTSARIGHRRAIIDVQKERNAALLDARDKKRELECLKKKAEDDSMRRDREFFVELEQARLENLEELERTRRDFENERGKWWQETGLYATKEADMETELDSMRKEMNRLETVLETMQRSMHELTEGQEKLDLTHQAEPSLVVYSDLTLGFSLLCCERFFLEYWCNRLLSI